MAAKKKAKKKAKKTKVTKKAKVTKKGKTKAFGKSKGGAIIGVKTEAGVDGEPSKALVRAFDNLRIVLRKERVNLVGVLEDVQGKVAVVATAREPNTIPTILRFSKILSDVAVEVQKASTSTPAPSAASGEAAAATAAPEPSPAPVPEPEQAAEAPPAAA